MQKEDAIALFILICIAITAVSLAYVVVCANVKELGQLILRIVVPALVVSIAMIGLSVLGEYSLTDPDAQENFYGFTLLGFAGALGFALSAWTALLSLFGLSAGWVWRRFGQ